ncbi:MAG TPA: Tn3 family transposase, partial [Candidatus Melainabacteria bacterium]|nr:Tn3 family transposase [Candidatus Melainabacteria bacterium]
DGLRSKGIWEPNAGRYQNPGKDLPQDFEDKRQEYYKSLKLPLRADTLIRSVQHEMKTCLEELDETILSNSKVRFSQTGKIIVTPLKAEPAPPNLESLGEELERRWSMTKLIDVLKETDFRTGFTRCFKSIATREVLDRKTIQRRLLVCFNAVGTNMGLKRGCAGESLSSLQHIMRRFVTADSARDAIRVVANDTFRVRQPDIWGEGTTACAADSKQFGSWDQNLMTEWHARYGGRGVMIYWHVERKSTCIYSQLKTCSSSEVASMLEGVLRHCTSMSVEKAYTDTHGKSEIGFAFCCLLGDFELLPRIKGIKKQKLYRPEVGNPQAFENLQPVLTRPINWEIIRQQYDEMVKLAAAIKCGTADAESILRRFTSDSPQHPTYTALLELGRAKKTIFLCRYLKSEELRREIHQGLNVIEHWNSVNGFIHFAKMGEFASNDLATQELSMLALHLLQNCMVYINTLMLQEILAEKAWADRLTPEDLRGLNPLAHRHINPFGDMSIDMNTRIALKAA